MLILSTNKMKKGKKTIYKNVNILKLYILLEIGSHTFGEQINVYNCETILQEVLIFFHFGLS